jgi:hypothetical protein
MRPAMVVGSLLATSALAVGMIVFGAVAGSTAHLRSGLDAPVPSSPEALLAELREEKARIDSITDGMADRVEAFNATRQPGQDTLRLSDVFYDDLTGSERDVLGTMLAAEEDVSYKALLQALARDRETIRGLQNRVMRMEQSLPDQFVVAAKGDSQYDLAMGYLTGEAGLERAHAEQVLSRIDMSDELVPGNKVWLFYDRGTDTFRTYVTQGDAGQMPIALRRALKRRLVTERDAARAHAEALTMDLELTRLRMESEVATLSEEIESLRDTRSRLETEVTDLTGEQEFLESRVSQLASALAEKENSLFFHAAAESELKDRGVITRFFKRFQDAKDVEYDRALNLTRGSTISLRADELGLEKIGRVKLLPSVFHAERDYVVERSEDGTTATVTILEPEIFRGKEVVLSVKG